MKVVIAGGSGLIGRHLSNALVREEHDVLILSREPDRVRQRLPQRARTIGWDPTGRDLAWAEHLANAEAVVNLCGASMACWPWTARTWAVLRESRIEPTNALVDAIASLPASDRPRALINASSIELYDGSDATPATEMTPLAESALGRLCLAWEEAALAAESFAVRVVLLRTAHVVARGAPNLERLVLPYRLFVGGPIGTGEQWVSWIHVDDAVGLIVRAISSWDICGPFNVAAPAPVRQRDFARLIGAVLHRPARVRLPARLITALFGEQAQLLLGSRRVWPAKALAASYEFHQADLGAALTSALIRG